MIKMKLLHIVCALLMIVASGWSDSQASLPVPKSFAAVLAEEGWITLAPDGVRVRKGEWDGEMIYQFFVIAPGDETEKLPPQFAKFSKIYSLFFLSLSELRSISETFEKNADKNEWAIGDRFPSRLYLGREGERWRIYQRDAPLRFQKGEPEPEAKDEPLAGDQEAKPEPKAKGIPLADLSLEDLRLMITLLKDATAEVAPPR